jgi:uncharacterized protein
MIKRIEEAVCKYFSTRENILAVFLLGSFQTGRNRPDSDIDIAVLPEGGSSLETSDLMLFTKDLSYEFARTVDIGIISSQHLVYAREALMKGMVLYVKDEDRMNLVRAYLLGMYLQFNLDRREVIDAYTAR